MEEAFPAISIRTDGILRFSFGHQIRGKKEERGERRKDRRQRGKTLWRRAQIKRRAVGGPLAQFGSVVLGAKLHTQGRSIPSKRTRGS